MVVETKKILDPKIKLVATCVRVPVFVGHSEAVNIEFENPITADEARDILRSAPGCLVIDKREDGGYVTPYEAAGEDATYISRIREDATVENGLVLWCVSDNLRKGAALNAVQIAECLINRKLIEAKRKAAYAETRKRKAPQRLLRGSVFSDYRLVAAARRRLRPTLLRAERVELVNRVSRADGCRVAVIVRARFAIDADADRADLQANAALDERAARSVVAVI